MIAINSTGYPCLAVAEHFNLDYDKVLWAGRILLEWHLTGRGADRLIFADFLPDLASTQLIDNYNRAAKEHGWPYVH